MAGERKIIVTCPKCGTEIVIIIVTEEHPIYPWRHEDKWIRKVVVTREKSPICDIRHYDWERKLVSLPREMR